MKYFCIGIILFVSINIYSQEFLTNDTLFSDTLKYEIPLPKPQFHLQNTDNQPQINFDLNYALDFSRERKVPLPYPDIRQKLDFELNKQNNIFLKNLNSNLANEYHKNSFSFQQFDSQRIDFSGFQTPDLFPDKLQVKLFENSDFSIETYRYQYHNAFEGINAAGVQLNWQANDRLKLSLQPSVGRFYYGLDIPNANYYGKFDFGVDYKVAEGVNLLLNTNYTFTNKNAPSFAPNNYPQNSITGGVKVKITEWLALQGGVAAIRNNDGTVQLMPYISPIIDWAKLLGIKKKKKREIPEYWY
ncbi:hypothetical protein FACS189429_6150 [Bacteroidia bacterium]|nr:hypothetical protein FACS189429_6150 [Bacteroidia bacterium]